MVPSARAGRYAYGEQFVRFGQNWADGGVSDANLPPVSSAVHDSNDYRLQLNALEEQGGPYADALAEPLAALGRQNRDNGDLEEAQSLYRRALHVVRINDGLYSERQIPILRELLDTYRLSGQLDILDSRYDYYFRLYGRGQPPFTEVRLRAALGYLRWQREAVRLGIDKDDSRRLLALYQLNENLLHSVGTDPSVPLHWYQELVLGQLRNLYLLEDRFSPGVENMGVAPETPLFPGEWKQEDFDKKRLGIIQRGGLSRGNALLQDLIARTEPAGDRVELARLYLEQGDWCQWHGSDKLARGHYQQVVQLLSEASRPDLVQQWLGQPVELPDNGAFWQPRADGDGLPQKVISVRYDVTARGRANNMHAVGDEAPASRLKRKLGKIRFRPRWSSGEAEAVSQIQRDYVLID